MCSKTVPLDSTVAALNLSRSSDNAFYAFCVYDTGLVYGRNYVFYNVFIGVRPSFYLKSGVALEGGTGSASDPYKLSVQ